MFRPHNTTVSNNTIAYTYIYICSQIYNKEMISDL